jgi:PIN domain nuclease of toxin-antitoxin system
MEQLPFHYYDPFDRLLVIPGAAQQFANRLG